MIEIQVVARAGRPWRDPQPVRFPAGGGTIGRGADCTLVLEDPERRISRKQAVIVLRDGVYILQQQGAGPGIEVAGQLLAAGQEYALAQGDEITVGPYVLRVVSVAVPVGNSAQAASALQQDPLALFGSVSEAAPENPLRAMLERDRPAKPDTRKPERSAPAREVDVNVGDPTGSIPRPVAGARAAGALPAAPSTKAAVDPAIAAFLAGAGIAELEIRDDAHAVLASAGRLFRESIQGALDLLAARSSAKRELNADATMLRSRENNPLKFSPTVETALSHLLAPAGRGFMAPEPAVRDAFDDLRAHQVAVLAGMRAALVGVLARFDPAKLEERLARKTKWETIVPAARKAKLWDLFNEHYAEIDREARDDFDTLFGRAFLEAYGAQLAAFRGGPTGKPGNSGGGRKREPRD